MKKKLNDWKTRDFEEFGHQVMLECNDLQRAKDTCSLHLQAYEDELQPELGRRKAELVDVRQRAAALHSALYHRPHPVSDAKMLSHGTKTRIVLVLTVLAGISCLVGNMITFYLLGFGFLLTLLASIGFTALPLVVGHLAYEWIVSKSVWIKILVVAAAVALVGAGILICGQARQEMVDRATSTHGASSYVDGQDAVMTDPKPTAEADEGTELKIHKTLGQGMFLVMLAAELALAFLFGYLIEMYSDDDHTAWRRLRSAAELATALEERISELMALPQIAKKLCLAGILRAQNMRRHPPYHRALTLLLIFLMVLTRSTWAQNAKRYEGILLDTSRSISRGGKTDEPFRKYLIATRRLLLTEPPSTRVWVVRISADSFGDKPEVLSGWTPEASGVFTDDLNRARHQLASSFTIGSSRMIPVARSTDIFGGLWRLKVLLESGSKEAQSPTAPKEIWILSDMVNETREFPMPTLFSIGPKRMLEHAQASGLVVPLPNYRIRVCGASTAGLTPRAWTTIKQFWELYFGAAGADLEEYSVECSMKDRTGLQID